MENPVIFADAFNQFLYHGEQRIDPTQLTELDTTGIVISYGADNAGVPEQKYRDVLKLLHTMTDGEAAYCVMGIENQADIHYALPVRNGVYDFLQLSHQVSEAANSHKRAMKEKEPKPPEQPQKEETPTDGEFLSGFWRTDRLIPVITLVIYFGSEAWDAPLSLKEMYSSTNNAVLAHAPNYHVNLLNKIPNINIWKDKLRKLLMLLRDLN